MNSKEEISEDLCPNYVQEFGLWFIAKFEVSGQNIAPTFYINLVQHLIHVLYIQFQEREKVYSRTYGLIFVFEKKKTEIK